MRKKGVCVFFIGTGHDTSEDANVLVVLNRLCKYQDLGVEGNHANDGTISQFDAQTSVASKLGARLQERITVPVRFGAVHGGWHWINQGQGGGGLSLQNQAEANKKIIMNLGRGDAVDNVYLIGHSRGAVCAVNVANRLYKEDFKANVHLFLYDPVKRSGAGWDELNREIHSNVKSLKVILAEDEAGTIGGVAGMFTPMMLKDRSGGVGAGVSSQNYLRLPGTHGTATQVNGMPIGDVGKMLALEWLSQEDQGRRVPMDERPTNAEILRGYGRISRECGVRADNTRVITDQAVVRTNTEISQRIVPIGGKNTSKFSRKGRLTRSQYLDKSGVSNRFQGHKYFINSDHANRFKTEYPNLARFVLSEDQTSRAGQHAWRGELAKMRTSDPAGWLAFARTFGLDADTIAGAASSGFIAYTPRAS